MSWLLRPCLVVPKWCWRQENIQEHIWELSAYCMDQLEAIGATIITHRDPGRRGGIVIARLYDDLDVDRWVLKQLHARKIFIAQRFTDYVGGFRISCQYFNNHADIDAMAAAMKELIQEIGRAPDYNCLLYTSPSPRD